MMSRDLGPERLEAGSSTSYRQMHHVHPAAAAAVSLDAMTQADRILSELMLLISWRRFRPRMRNATGEGYG
jgi:hypothetical protein